ncbi:MAG: rRNA (adenine1518-N6/adenine1519-N6)-dimethyltransferase [Solirubrobacterales bacterium]|jgi:16S rRNA (adenine1518-N6/adenine1519-N6)-dimethyltransferase|nr:rRNA (adenine1518-N6/adenine1519-N6)-dimethyltransferase [Solirubrobacterales bacterium]MDX6651323.1 rRNA (adenine1518-N6/adenine1519-N6)-dimethyltransferase [Solirubrobacterales bacterium]
MVSRRQRRLGQNFLADQNLLEAIVRHAELEPTEVILEIGGGAGALTQRLAPEVLRLHVVEKDERLRKTLEGVATRASNVELHWGDAMKIGLRAFDPTPTKLVANLPYSIATPLLLRTIEEMPELTSWTVMVQREIADRLSAAPGSRVYGAPSVLAQVACDIELLRKVDPAVFKPRPKVDSALIGLRRRGSAAPEPLRRLVRGAFAHRRKALPRSLELAVPGSRKLALEALEGLGLPLDARAEALSPTDFIALALRLAPTLVPEDAGR